MRFAVTSTVEARSWDELLAADASSSFFHSRTWCDLVQLALPHAETFFATASDGELLVAGLPIVVRSRGPVRLAESMPFGTYGGVVARHDAPRETARRLVETLLEKVGGTTVGQVRFVDFNGRLSDACESFASEESDAQIVRLGRPFDEVWDGFRPSARNKVRKAEKAGVTVREARGIEDYLAYYALLEECSERWGTENPFGVRFFEALARSGDKGIQLLVAEHEGRVIAGDLNFLSATSAFNWGNVSHRDSVRLAPNSLLHARGMEEACRRGLLTYNLGGSGGIDAVAKFKSAFGTERVTYVEHVLEKPWMRLGRRLRDRRGGEA